MTSLWGLWEYSAQVEAIQATEAAAEITAAWRHTERTRWLSLCLATFAAAAISNGAFEWRYYVNGTTVTVTSIVAIVILLIVLSLSVMYVGALPELRWMEINGCCVHGPLFVKFSPLVVGGPALLLGGYLRKRSAPASDAR